MLYLLDAHSGLAAIISPSKCLGLEPKWHCHFGIPRQRAQLNYVSILMMGCLWGFVGVDILQISTLPFSPADHHASDIGVAAPFQKVYQLTAYNAYSVANHQQRGQRSLIAIPWTSHVHNCNRTYVLACCV